MTNHEPPPLSITPIGQTPTMMSTSGSSSPPTPLPNPPTPTRPAPQSPALSRRTSQVPSLTSGGGGSTSSKPNSRRNSRRTSGLRDSLIRSQFRLSSSGGSGPLSSIPTASFLTKPSLPSSSSSTTTTTTTTGTRKLWTIKIRDFGFGGGDDRHRGLGPDEYVPKANRVKYLIKVLNAHLRSSAVSAVSASEDPNEEEEEEEEDWGYEGGDWGYPLLTTTMTTTASMTSTASTSASAAGEGEGEEGYFDEDDEDPQPLFPGLYRALYAFVPEGPTEKALDEGELVRVVGRGGGSGWAVVVVEDKDKDQTDSRKHALVPESYLEIVEPDPPAVEGGDSTS